MDTAGKITKIIDEATKIVKGTVRVSAPIQTKDVDKAMQALELSKHVELVGESRKVVLTLAIEAGSIKAYGLGRKEGFLTAQAGFDLVLRTAKELGGVHTSSTGKKSYVLASKTITIAADDDGFTIYSPSAGFVPRGVVAAGKLLL